MATQVTAWVRDGRRLVVEAHGISKTFGKQRVLDDVDLTVASGEVCGLLGHNGSGKSTLIKILSGAYEPDTGGALRLGGDDVRLPVVSAEVEKYGVGFVHQDLGLIPGLSVLENFRLVHLATAKRPWINWRRERRYVRAALGELGLDFDLHQPVSALSRSNQALLAVARAVEGLKVAPGGRGLLVLDEVTVFLPAKGVLRLFTLIKTLSGVGHGVLFVSHDLDQVMEITDKIVVLRDGQVVGHHRTADVTRGVLVGLITGLTDQVPEKSKVGEEAITREVALDTGSPGPTAPPAATVRDLRGPNVKETSFTVRPGEILGLAGIAGSGYDDVPYYLFGATPAEGTLFVGADTYDLSHLTPNRAVRHRIALVPSDRKLACFGGLSGRENISAPVLRRHYLHGVLDWRGISAEAKKLYTDFDVRPNDPEAMVRNLSGGNQQKVVLAKWLNLHPRLLILHEPTAGVDVGARQEIFRLVRAAAAGGLSVICASADHEQLAELCDRVLIFRNGEVVNELIGNEMSKVAISRECIGSERAVS